ncbi:hypothetical protein C8J56DRAFT_1026386 [Mycena floridula]|nr:hypothetical protein C8J56DRAFT_1026386 [Mycena floridula]
MSGGPDTRAKSWPPLPATPQSGGTVGKELHRLTNNMHHCLALVFHGAPYFMDQRDYYESFPSSQWMTHYLKLSAHHMLEGHNLGGYILYQAGAGIMLALLPNMTIRYGCCKIIMREVLMIRPDVAFWPHRLQHQNATLRNFQEIQLFGQTNMSLFATWACEANHFIHDLPINIMNLQTELHPPWARFQCNVIKCWKKDTESSAVNKLQNTDYFYFFCHVQAAIKYWSEDEHAQHIIEDSLIQAAFGISVDCSWYYPVYHIPLQFYQILQTIHEACEFNPYCTQIAEYLGLPLVVTDNLL